jgi:hypothetical protein
MVAHRCGPANESHGPIGVQKMSAGRSGAAACLRHRPLSAQF